MILSKTNFNNSLKDSKELIPFQKELLKKYFSKTFEWYENYEHLQEKPNAPLEDASLWLTTNGVRRKSTCEIKLSGNGPKRTRHKKAGIYSAECISKKEINWVGKSLRNPTADLLILIEKTGNTENPYNLIGVYYWKKFADWFDQHWQEYEENETKTIGDNGEIWHTDNRLIPLSIFEIFRVGDY